jgi:hypothetical protein
MTVSPRARSYHLSKLLSILKFFHSAIKDQEEHECGISRMDIPKSMRTFLWCHWRSYSHQKNYESERNRIDNAASDKAQTRLKNSRPYIKTVGALPNDSTTKPDGGAPIANHVLTLDIRKSDDANKLKFSVKVSRTMRLPTPKKPWT